MNSTQQLNSKYNTTKFFQSTNRDTASTLNFKQTNNITNAKTRKESELYNIEEEDKNKADLNMKNKQNSILSVSDSMRLVEYKSNELLNVSTKLKYNKKSQILPSILPVSPDRIRKVTQERFRSMNYEENDGSSRRTQRFSSIKDNQNGEQLDNQKMDIIDDEVLNENMMIRIINSQNICNNLDNISFNKHIKSVLDENDYEMRFNQTNYANKLSHQIYYEKYKQHREFLRKEIVNKQTPSLAFINQIKLNKKCPLPLGLIKKKGEEGEINLDSYGKGNVYCNIISKSISYADFGYVKKLNFSQNILTNEGVREILINLTLNRKIVMSLKILNLSNNLIGHKGASYLNKFISNENCKLKEIILENTGITNDSINLLSYSITMNIDSFISVLNFGKNGISDKCYLSICSILEKCEFLKVLQIHDNLFSNKAGAEIVKSLQKNREMKFFDISWNKLGNNLQIELSKEEIYKKENPLRTAYRNFDLKEFSKTMTIRFKDIELPTEQKEKKGKEAKPDLNKIIKFQKNIKVPETILSPFAKALGDYFKEKSIKLIHLNISNNSLNLVDCTYLSESVKSNNTILGIHVDGNEMIIDSLGFIYPYSKSQREESFFSKSQITYDVYYNKEEKIHMGNSLLHSKIKNNILIKSKNNCWICEGWKETSFVLNHSSYYIGKERENCTDAKLYLEIDNYSPFEMTYVQYEKKSVAYRMCPPGNIKYFFSLNNSLVDSHTLEIEYLKEPIQINLNNEKKEEEESKNSNTTKRNSIAYLSLKKGNKGLIPISVNGQNNLENINSYRATEEDNISNNASFSKSQNEKIYSLNKINIEPNYNNIDNHWINHIHFCIPRPSKDIEIQERPKTPWTYDISIWAKLYCYEYNGEPEEKITNAFEFDYSRCSFNKDFKNEEINLIEFKEYMRSCYNKIIHAYKNLSSQVTPIWQIGNSTLLDFFNKSNLFLNQQYPQSFMILKLQGVKSQDNEEIKKKNKNIPEGIVRHQFMNLIVKVSIDKYINKTKQCKSALDAVKYSFENNFNAGLNNFDDPQIWRRSRYYNEKCDNFIQAFLPLLYAIYKSWSTKKEIGKKEKYMIIDDFHNLCTACVNKECPVREIDLYFNQAISLQDNEIDNERHYYIIFPEFLEAFIRVIDKASIGTQENSDLIVKLDIMKSKFYDLILNSQEFKQVKEKFIFPEKDLKYNLYEFDINSQFYREILFPETNDIRRSIKLPTLKKDLLQERFKSIKENNLNDKSS